VYLWLPAAFLSAHSLASRSFYCRLSNEGTTLETTLEYNSNVAAEPLGARYPRKNKKYTRIRTVEENLEVGQKVFTNFRRRSARP
jgi:hypothetical protein